MKKPLILLLIFLSILLIRPFNTETYAERLAEREILPNGITLLHSEKKALPIITVVMAIKAGSVVEPHEKTGLANLAADLLNEGTSRRTSKKISDEIEFVGGSLSTSGGSDYITVSLTVLKKDLELGFDLLSDIILNPSFNQDEINRRKKVIKSAIIQQNEEPGIVASKAFSKAVFGVHPYGRPVEGTFETLDNISRQDIVDFHSSYYSPNNTIMAVVGDIDKNQLKSSIDKYFKNWPRKEIKYPDMPSPKSGSKAEVIKINKNITQANIILGHLGIKRDEPDYYAVSVMNYILGGGGFASRLMDNIRDNKGLSYDVHSYFSANKYSGSFQVGLQTKNNSANQAINEILNEMDRIRTEKVSDKELDNAKLYLTGSFPLRIDSNRKIAAFLIAVEFYDLGLDYADDYKKFIEAVSKNDILRAAEKYLDTRNYILVIVGDIEKAALEY